MMKIVYYDVSRILEYVMFCCEYYKKKVYIKINICLTEKLRFVRLIYSLNNLCEGHNVIFPDKAFSITQTGSCR